MSNSPFRPQPPIALVTSADASATATVNRANSAKGANSAVRTTWRSRSLPNYSKPEELSNMITHAVGVLLGLVILITCLIVAAWHNNVAGIVGGAIFGVAVIALYGVSATYHGLLSAKSPTGKRIMQVLDHCTIYFLIAGTYMPILLSSVLPVYPTLAWAFFGAIWGLAALAIVLTATIYDKTRIFGFVCYIALGWGIITIAPVLLEVLTLGGFLLVLFGGIAYTIGSVLYALGHKKQYIHALFHIFCLAGTVLHALAIIFHCL